MMARIVFALAAAAAFALTTAGAPLAQDGPVGIAFVEAPEQGSGVCVAGNLDRAFACAREQCTASGALPGDCLRVRWCYPAGWSADIFMQHKEGLHWHSYLCGWQSQADLDAAIRIACEGSSAEWLIECSVVRKWDDTGAEIEVR